MTETQEAFRDFLIRFQQTAIRETGRRPTVALRDGIDEELLMPGCLSAGYSFWQPMPWPQDMPQLADMETHFHRSILDLFTFCRYHELSFVVPVPQRQGIYSYLYKRQFVTVQNTMKALPLDALNDAIIRHDQLSKLPLYFPFAATDPQGEAFVLCLQADTGECCLFSPSRENVYHSLGLSVCEMLKLIKPSFL